MQIEQVLAAAQRAMGQGNPLQAANALESVVQHAPTSAEAWHLLGNARAALRRVDDAREAFRRAIALDPRLAKSHANLGRLALDAGDLNQATTHLERAVELEPGGFRARTSLAGAYALA